MKCLGRVLLFTISLVLPIQANADEWNKYIQIRDRFYNLGKQEFNTISCSIEVSAAINQIRQLRAQFEPMKDMIELQENLEDFNLTYNKSGGLNFNYPSLDIKIISEKGMADPAKVKEGIEMVKAGFRHQIEGTVMQLHGLFDEFAPPKKSQHKIKEIKKDEATYSITYETENSAVTETYSQNQRKVRQKSKNGDEISSVEKYNNIADDKLFLTDAQAVIHNAMGNTEMDMTISYEKVKGVLFPSHIEIRFKQTLQTIKQEGQNDIYLKNCTLR